MLHGLLVLEQINYAILKGRIALTLAKYVNSSSIAIYFITHTIHARYNAISFISSIAELITLKGKHVETYRVNN